MAQRIKCYDSGPAYFDRYTVVWQEAADGEYSYVGMSENPFHPLGFGQYGSTREKPKGRHLGRLIPFSELPVDCQTLINRDLAAEDTDNG